ncbi:MAG: TfoX/Sxy family protein [Bacteroidota bacterium]
MPTDQSFVDYVVEQIQTPYEIIAKKMFGEYGVWADGKFFALICDNKFFIKPTNSGKTFIGTPEEAPPYQGAKNYFLIDEKLEDKSWLTQLVKLTYEELPAPKPKKKRKKH